MQPDTKYAKSGDVRVAYQVTGEGPVDLVLAPGTASHLDLDWEWPEKASFLERLGSFCRLIRFDKRGTGLSDRPTDAATLEERMDDIRAVMDAAGSDRAVIFGYSEGANLALLFAATFPERTRALVLWGAQARWVRADDYPWGPTREEAEKEIAYLAENGVTLEYLTGPGAGIPKDLPYVRFFMRYLKASASPSALAALERMLGSIDMRDILPSVRVPVVVMNRTGDPVANVEAARDVAARIPGARFVEFPGDAHPFFTGPATGEILAEIETFVTGVRLPPAADRVLVTVLFTDIVVPPQSSRPSATTAGASFSTATTPGFASSWNVMPEPRSTPLATASSRPSTGRHGPFAARALSAMRSRRSVWRSAPACIPARSNAKGPRPPASRYMWAQGLPPWPSRVKCSSPLPSSS